MFKTVHWSYKQFICLLLVLHASTTWFVTHFLHFNFFFIDLNSHFALPIGEFNHPDCGAHSGRLDAGVIRLQAGCNYECTVQVLGLKKEKSQLDG